MVDTAQHCGVPPDAAPVVALFTVNTDGIGIGWTATTAGRVRREIELRPRCPPGELGLTGALLRSPLADDTRPCLRIDNFNISVYQAELTIPDGRAVARVSWPPKPTEIPPTIIELRPGQWTGTDVAKATAAARWLETLLVIRRRPEITRAVARKRLIQLADQVENDGNPIDPYTLSAAANRASRTINYWLNRAEWGIEDLRIAHRTYKRRQATKKSN